ncbi:Formyltransferase [Dothidotthia symphoricarpi CBS 119687]|uniref:methionyl-tRNA formyltransferase n=1 Tax=Dothidotthia symphoricarpi CBS 119687 TaxID=1392245 RepID=A0A6A6A6C0_9PLEO|nr:Formyltransferase [Dothidotthia symphoricarpi CBS 119687]KAF2127429.1 Formyltransferase [Dothidotthia symphoricarpi CBS 119687]
MLWKLPYPVRSLVLPTLRRHASTEAPTRAAEPLRILFCGSDDFSIASLRALCAAKRVAPKLIHSIHVVHRPAKPAGRGLKTLRDVPIKHVASDELCLDTHAIDTFTGWTPPIPINLVVAVSFGLFVPPRILNLAQYSGLNVHPSLLPDLRGPAPIEHAILKRRRYTGVSIQTLHPTQFDQGTILAQTPSPGVEISRGLTSANLEKQLAEAGAELLVKVLKEHKFVPPLDNVGWYANPDDPTRPVDHAEKITKQHRFIDFSKCTMDQILAVQHALDNPWCILPNGDRLILHQVVDTGKAGLSQREPGIWAQKGYNYPLFQSADGQVGIIVKSTYAGSKTGQGNAKLLRLLPAQDHDDSYSLDSAV